MTASSPIVSIGMPVYNDRLFIHKSLDSILSQSYTDFELILSDDGSTDGSGEICKEYASRDPRIRYIRQPRNIGVSRNMEFLLNEARGEYFMWAGNDDILSSGFIFTLKSLLETDSDAVLAFCTTILIDEQDKHIKVVNSDYSGDNALLRISKLINEFEDSCGYGLFRTSMIREVKFPVWWSVNRTRAYNNIYPTLCFYLAKGQFLFYRGEPLFFKRIKMKHVNHRVPYTSSFLKGMLAFLLWKFNMVYCSLKQIHKASGSLLLPVRIFPRMVWYWFIIPSIEMIGIRYSALRKGQMKFW